MVGSGRQPLQKDKTASADYYLLTLAAIAREIDYRQADRTAVVHLAAGLPLTSFGRDKRKFASYLCRNGKPVCFRWEGRNYTVMISDVSLFPQGYEAILTQSDLLDEPSVIVADIGGWTVDVMRFDIVENSLFHSASSQGRKLHIHRLLSPLPIGPTPLGSDGVPNAATCRSLELGMIRCLDEIAEKVRRVMGLSLTPAQIESVLQGGGGSLADAVKEIVHREAGVYVHGLLSAIQESGLDTRAMPTVFLGGGAAFFDEHGNKKRKECFHSCLRGPHWNPAKRFQWGAEEQGSGRSFRPFPALGRKRS